MFHLSARNKKRVAGTTAGDKTASAPNRERVGIGLSARQKKMNEYTKPRTDLFPRAHSGTAPAPPYCKFYKTLDWPLKQSETGAWWVSGGKKSAGCHVEITFNNGQKATVVATGKFNTLKPRITLLDTAGYTPYRGKIELGFIPYLSLVDNPMRFDAYISKTYPGKFGMTQLVKMSASTLGKLSTTFGEFWLDGSSEYYDGETTVTLSEYPSDDQYGSPSSINDPPGTPLLGGWGEYHGDWKTYVRFTPDGDGIAVTLGLITWTWNSHASQDIHLFWQLDSDAVTGPTLDSGDDSFPVWSTVRSGD